MTSSTHRFSVLSGPWTILRLPADAPVPPWAWLLHEFISITRTPDELSIVCPEDAAPPGGRAEAGWAVLKIEGPFPFEHVGVLASFTTPLAAAGISLFAISTFDTDYVLIKADQLSAATHALVVAGHTLLT